MQSAFTLLTLQPTFSIPWFIVRLLSAEIVKTLTIKEVLKQKLRLMFVLFQSKKLRLISFWMEEKRGKFNHHLNISFRVE